MRFMVLLKANRDSETGMLPSTELLAAMGKYNPHAGDAEIEIRQVFEIEDFPNVPDEVRELELQQRKPAKRLEAAAN